MLAPEKNIKMVIADTVWGAGWLVQIHSMIVTQPACFSSLAPALR